jgi:DNA-directed RNA polymerase specialized sigma24 family protein
LNRVHQASGINLARTPLILKEALRWRKVRTKFQPIFWRFSRSIDAKGKGMAGFVLPLCPTREIAEEPMEPREKPDSYGEWAIDRVQQEAEEDGSVLPAEVITTARAVWPRVVAAVASELKREGSGRDAEALAAEIWEGVLRSVAKALQRKSTSSLGVRDFESYLLAAFHHRFHRFQRAERGRLDRFQLASASLDSGLVEGALDTECVVGLERAITLREITDRMDPWTRKAWQARQYGYSWKDIAAWSGLSEQAAKKKFEYGLGKTKQRFVGLLKAEKPNEPA